MELLTEQSEQLKLVGSVISFLNGRVKFLAQMFIYLQIRWKRENRRFILHESSGEHSDI